MPTEKNLVIAPSEDVEIICSLARTIWPISYAGILSETQIDNLLAHIYSPAQLRHDMAHQQRYFLAFLYNNAVGYMSCAEQDACVWVKKLYVCPSQQGKGIGTAFIDYAQALHPFAKRLCLLVNRENYAAQQFYRRQGFSHTEDVPVCMGDYHFIDHRYEKMLP